MANFWITAVAFVVCTIPRVTSSSSCDDLRKCKEVHKDARTPTAEDKLNCPNYKSYIDCLKMISNLPAECDGHLSPHVDRLQHTYDRECNHHNPSLDMDGMKNSRSPPGMTDLLRCKAITQCKTSSVNEEKMDKEMLCTNYAEVMRCWKDALSTCVLSDWTRDELDRQLEIVAQTCGGFSASALNLMLYVLGGLMTLVLARRY